MSIPLTIHLSQADYEALRAAAERAHQSPEDLIAAAVVERYGRSAPQSPEGPVEDPVIRIMHERGHLLDPRDLPPLSHDADMPPAGSGAAARRLEEIGEELSDAIERMGKRPEELIER